MLRIIQRCPCALPHPCGDDGRSLRRHAAGQTRKARLSLRYHRRWSCSACPTIFAPDIFPDLFVRGEEVEATCCGFRFFILIYSIMSLYTHDDFLDIQDVAYSSPFRRSDRFLVRKRASAHITTSEGRGHLFKIKQAGKTSHCGELRANLKFWKAA